MSCFMLKEQEEDRYDICSEKGEGAKEQQGNQQTRKTEEGNTRPAVPDVDYLLVVHCHLLTFPVS